MKTMQIPHIKTMNPSKEKISFSVYAKTPKIINEIQKGAQNAEEEDKFYQPHITSELYKAVDYLNYGQSKSRLFIVEFDANDEELINTLAKIHDDPWLHGTVIVVISSKLSKLEMDQLLKFGVIDFISINEIKYKFPTVIKIITSNTEIFESQQFIAEHSTQKKGTITIKNSLLLVPKATNILLNFCYAVGFRNLDTYSKISICLHEMITNAIEHGNCEIGYSMKTNIINQNLNIVDIVKERASLPENLNKRVRVRYNINSKRAVIVVIDEGKGFNSTDIPNPLNEDNVFMVHGRGIMMTRTFVDEMSYNTKGNKVRLVFYNELEVLRREGDLHQLTSEPVLHLKAGEVLFEDDSESDYFYYILSGKLGVYVNNKQVAISTPEDMFVGEMAFLHHNRRTGTVKALSSAKLLPISRNGFINMIKKYPYAGVFLARLLTKRLAEKNRETT
ncbi:MAG: ATP-binding protein [Leptospiraceae bacterium]|nr:ATP-binding protein [Leptospiraceae bacterium]